MNRIELLRLELTKHLSKIVDLLPGPYKITLIARNTENDNAHIVIGDDDIYTAVKAIELVEEVAP